MLILDQSSEPVQVTFSYTGKANFAGLKHQGRYNTTPAGTDSAWTSLRCSPQDGVCPPTSTRVSPLPCMWLFPSITQTDGEPLQKVSKKKRGGGREQASGHKVTTSAGSPCKQGHQLAVIALVPVRLRA